MFKILIVVVIIIVLSTILAAVNFLSPKPVTPKPPDTTTTSAQEVPESTASGGLLEQIKRVTATSTPGTQANISLQDHVSLLESTVSVLQKRLDVLEKNQGITPSSSASPTTNSKNQYPLYIPLGAAGSLSNPFYVSLDMFQISLDPADYPGYTSLELEANFKSDQNNGPTYVRLYNNTDGGAVSGSEVSGTSDQYTLLTSPKFTLPSGKKTYVLQAKNNSNTQTQIQSARLKVNF